MGQSSEPFLWMPVVKQMESWQKQVAHLSHHKLTMFLSFAVTDQGHLEGAKMAETAGQD